MSNDWIFRLLLAALVTGVLGVRIYYRRLAAKNEGQTTQIERGWNVLFRVIIGLTGIGVLLVQILVPEVVAWARLDLPEWVRWVGVIFGAGTLALLVWVHEALRENFSSTLHIRAEHTLVTSGPYHWVRHPMYTSFYLLVAAFFLLSANWLIGLSWLAGLTLVMITRIAREEAVMGEKFGAAYQTYMRQTGRFLPRLGA